MRPALAVQQRGVVANALLLLVHSRAALVELLDAISLELGLEVLEPVEHIFRLRLALVVSLPVQAVEAFVAARPQHRLGELGADEGLLVFDLASGPRDARPQLVHRPRRDGELDPEVAAHLHEPARRVHLLGRCAPEDRVQEVGVEVHPVAGELLGHELLRRRVDRQHRHVEADVQQAGEEATLLGRRLARGGRMNALPT
jgi:hypothetical protein